MRFNDYHKDVCRALGLTEDEQRRAVRTDVMRCYATHKTVNAAVAVVRMIERAKAEKEAFEAKARGLS